MAAHPHRRRRAHTGRRPRPDGGYWNKALGFCEPLTGDARRRGRRARQRARACRPWPSSSSRAPSPADYAATARAAGLTHGHDVRQVLRSAPSRARSRPTCGRPLGPEHAAEFVRVMARRLRLPRPTPMPTRCSTEPSSSAGDWATVGAWDGDDAGRRGRICSSPADVGRRCSVPPPCPQGRGRGAQGALLDARLREARDRGLPLGLDRDLAGERRQPEPVAAQHAAGRPHRALPAAGLGLPAAWSRVLEQPQRRPARARPAARRASPSCAGRRRRSCAPPRRRRPPAGRRTTTAPASGCCRGTPRPPSSPPTSARLREALVSPGSARLGQGGGGEHGRVPGAEVLGGRLDARA